jgi:thiaminase/transcriptional activator TenA
LGVTPIAETRFYVDFLLNTARRGRLGETIAAMTPCMRLYAWLGSRSPGPPSRRPMPTG